MNLTQNQYYGLKRDLPSKLPEGSTYNCTDASEFYIYNMSGKPIAVSSGDSDDGDSEVTEISFRVGLTNKLTSKSVTTFDGLQTLDSGIEVVTSFKTPISNVVSESAIEYSIPGIAVAAIGTHWDEGVDIKLVNFTRTGVGTTDISWYWNGVKFIANVTVFN